LTSSPERGERRRTFQTGHQRIIGWIVFAWLLVMPVVFVVLPHEGDGVYPAGALSLVVAVGVARFALSRVIASDDGVRVVNVLQAVDLRWEEIDTFELAATGPCQIRLKDGATVAMTGIQQKNISGMLGTQNTPERRMIDELNALLEERGRPEGGGSGTAG
jgi:hypothetical protein